MIILLSVIWWEVTAAGQVIIYFNCFKQSYYKIKLDSQLCFRVFGLFSGYSIKSFHCVLCNGRRNFPMKPIVVASKTCKLSLIKYICNG